MSSNTSEINFTIGLDENRVPSTLNWTAKDGGIENEEAKSIMLSVWDGNVKESKHIDLWTKDMPVDEMKVFVHQKLVALQETFLRATGDEKMSETMKDFCEYFAEKLNLKKN